MFPQTNTLFSAILTCFWFPRAWTKNDSMKIVFMIIQFLSCPKDDFTFYTLPTTWTRMTSFSDVLFWRQKNIHVVLLHGYLVLNTPWRIRTSGQRFSIQHHVSMTTLSGLLAGLFLRHFSRRAYSLYGSRVLVSSELSCVVGTYDVLRYSTFHFMCCRRDIHVVDQSHLPHERS